MTIEAPAEGRIGSAHRELRLAELVALGLLEVEGLADDMHIELLSPQGVGDPVEGEER